MKDRNWEELIGQSRSGDCQAQEKLVLAVQDRVYYHCLKMLKNTEDAKDATQEILISMLTGLDSLRQPNAFLSWLHRMTSNTCCRWLSRSRRQPVLWSDEPAGAPLNTYENLDDQMIPDKILDNEESRRMVVELVEALPEAQRLSVLFYYYEEMSIQEIAEAMETSENTVKSRLHYAREAIRKGVDRYADQGFKLYGLTPVPFLRYFLQKEAASTAAALAGKAALAASAGAAAAVGKSAVTAALSKALGGVLAHKGFAAAGLALAVAIAGGSLLRRPAAPPPERAPERPSEILTETVPYTPEETAPPAAPEETPEPPAEPLLTAPVWMGEPSAPAAEPIPAAEPLSPEPETDLAEEPPEVPSAPEDEEVPAVPSEPEPEEPEEPEPSKRPDPAPDRGRDNRDDGGSNDDDSDDDDNRRPSRPNPVPTPDPEPEPNPEPDPDPGPSPNPDPEPDPGPEQPEVPVPPAVSVQYTPDPNFGDYLGETEEGVHEFLLSIRLPDRNTDRFPFQAGEFFSRLEIVNPLLVRADGPYIYGSQEGETDVKYYVSEKEEGPYELKALVHVTVLRSQPIQANRDGYKLVGTTAEGVFIMEQRDELFADGKELPPMLTGERLIIELESGDPSVVAVRPETNRFYTVAPGTVQVRAYVRYAPDMDRELKALMDLTVQPPPPPPEGTAVCAPREDFSPENGAEGTQEAAYQGINAQGLYDFTVTVREGDVFHLQPLVEGSYDSCWGIENSMTVEYAFSGKNVFQAMESGDTDVTFTVCPEGGTFYSECAVVHVHVLPAHEPYYPNPDFGECLGRDDQDVWHFRAELLTEGPSLPSPLEEGNYYLRAVSSNPGVVAVRDGRIYGLTPGHAEISYYVSPTEEGGYILQAIVSAEVTSAEPELPETPLIPPGAEVINLEPAYFGSASGYGCNDRFSSLWNMLNGTPLPSTLEYRSSDPEVAIINEKGQFTTLSAGRVVLAASDPNDPSVCYTLTLQVEDHFDWTVYISDWPVYVGVQDYNIISSYGKDYETTLVGIEWTSGDPDLLTVTPFENDHLRCHLLGHAPGTVTVTGTARFALVTAADKLVEMTDDFTFRVDIFPYPEQT